MEQQLQTYFLRIFCGFAMFEIAYDRAHQFGVEPMIISHRQTTIAVIYLQKFVFNDSLQVKTLAKYERNLSAIVSASTHPSTCLHLLLVSNLDRQHFQKEVPFFLRRASCRSFEYMLSFILWACLSRCLYWSRQLCLLEKIGRERGLPASFHIMICVFFFTF